MLLLLDLLNGTVLEGESVDVGFIGSTLDDFGLGDGRGPFGESTELDQGLHKRKTFQWVYRETGECGKRSYPDIGEVALDNGAFENVSGSGNRHCSWV